MSASLLAATVAGHADSAMAQAYYEPQDARNDNFGPGVAYSEFNSAILVYQEAGGRVEATEPTASLTIHGADGRALSLGVVADAISGATPNGAVPSDKSQTFVTPIKARGSSASVTSASGGSTIIQLPPTPGQLAQAALGRQYTVAPNTLPVDKGFRDHRGAITFGWSQPLGVITQAGFGGGYSRESDYQSITGNVNMSQNFNSDNSTVSLALNTELDSSFPYGGIPTPMTPMSAQWKPSASRDKTQLGLVVGLTEVMSRNWLMQLNYSYDAQTGYLNDPYRIISVVDPVSGEPTSSLYESRPGKRQSQSIYWNNKIDLGPAVTEIGYRYFKDSWGIASQTADVSERINFSRSFYIQPSARWYQQSAANFFHDFLLGNQPLPAYASSDLRLGKFHALTYGTKIGYKWNGRSEIYLQADYYVQAGNAHPSDAIGQLKQQNLFAGTKATFFMVGYQWDFH
jgi:hypothetical protein